MKVIIRKMNSYPRGIDVRISRCVGRARRKEGENRSIFLSVTCSGGNNRSCSLNHKRQDRYGADSSTGMLPCMEHKGQSTVSCICGAHTADGKFPRTPSCNGALGNTQGHKGVGNRVSVHMDGMYAEFSGSVLEDFRYRQRPSDSSGIGTCRFWSNIALFHRKVSCTRPFQDHRSTSWWPSVRSGVDGA